MIFVLLKNDKKNRSKSTLSKISFTTKESEIFKGLFKLQIKPEIIESINKMKNIQLKEL